ncbi:class I SAM-dependent methyltransferase [Streptomyces milbemycinicus]|uniref:Class I SAM-dependent methyltransferase n=1 Tax=Streptomyces milbemycinicus TaxID=476552 RepID=A0ABW8M6V2_9ACTN
MRVRQSVLGARHLEIGAGTGYFPDKARFPVARPEITLLDLNPKTLEYADRRLARLHPRTIQANALDQLSSWRWVAADSFDSVALNLLLHCIPGSIAERRTRSSKTWWQPDGRGPGWRGAPFWQRESPYLARPAP